MSDGFDIFMDHQPSTRQAPVTASPGEVSATVLPTRFAETSAAVLPTLTAPSTVRQMTYVPAQLMTVSGSSTSGFLTE
jgi:hypothetical protein